MTVLATAGTRPADHLALRAERSIGLSRLRSRGLRWALAGAAALIWTTTPWTLPGNRAIAFRPGLDYAVIRVERVAEGRRARPGEAAGDWIIPLQDALTGDYPLLFLCDNTRIDTPELHQGPCVAGLGFFA